MIPHDRFNTTLAALLFAALAISACSPTESPKPDAAPESKPEATAAGGSAAGAINEDQLQALQWRNIGPFNGGRGTTVVGHPTDPMVFWFGHSSGGLWKTEDAGAYWMPVGEGQFKYASVGAMALYEKNPDIMYVGLGEPQLRQSVSWGDGMYKSVDGGETWEAHWAQGLASHRTCKNSST